MHRVESIVLFIVLTESDPEAAVFRVRDQSHNLVQARILMTT